MIRVSVESPLAGDFRRNVRYAQLCMLDSLRRGEAPYLSHLLYPQVYDDADPQQRKLSIEAGRSYLLISNKVAFYTDLGMSPGMEEAEKLAQQHRIPRERRSLIESGFMHIVTRQTLESLLSTDPSWMTTISLGGASPSALINLVGTWKSRAVQMLQPSAAGAIQRCAEELHAILKGATR